MCGICGVYGLHFSKPEKELFENLLMINSLRGRDSTGVIRVDGKKKQHVRSIKTLMPSYEFIGNEKGQRSIWANLENPKDKSVFGGDPIAYIGHCRSATKGSVDIKNAHPFEFDNVIGVHNGTIRGYFPHSNEYETDSEALYRNINDYGIEEALKTISHLDAAYALVWIDKKDKSINFIRNARRPMYFTFMFGRTSLVWSSDRDHLDVGVKACPGLNQGWDPKDKEGDGYFYLKPYQHMKIFLGKDASSAKIEGLDIKETFTVGGTVRTVGRTTQNNTDNAGSDVRVKGSDGVYRTPQAHQEYEARVKKGELAPSKDKYQDYHGQHQDLSKLPWLATELPPTSPGYGGVPMTTAELGFKLSCGCVSCGEKIKLEDLKTNKREVYWWSRDHYSCDNCYENSPGDWVRTCFGDMEQEIPVGVSVH